MDAHPQLLRAQALKRFLEGTVHSVDHVRELDATLGGRLALRVDLVFGPTAKNLDDALIPPHENLGSAVADAEATVAESLSFLAAASARRTGMDDGMTRAAERWLDSFSERLALPTVAVVIPSHTEFTGMTSQVIKLKIPFSGYWGLPVAAHEYGHFVASVLTQRVVDDGVARTSVPVEEFLHGSAADQPYLYDHGHELFADGLAVLLSGPAYVEYCLRYRFDVDQAHGSKGTHPPYSRRIRFQLRVLNTLAGSDDGGFLQMDANRLGRSWTTRLDAVGMKVDPPADQALDRIEDRLSELLLNSPPLRACQYRNHRLAHALAAGTPTAIQGATVSHALNAGWQRRIRLEHTGQLDHDPSKGSDEIDAQVQLWVRQVL